MENGNQERIPDYFIKSYPRTLNGQFLHQGDNFLFYGVLKPYYIKEKGIWVPGLEVFSDC